MPDLRRPERTCVGCRGKSPKEALVRVVRGPDGLVRVDVTGVAKGRGAYVHPDRSCVARAARTAALGRALRAPLVATEAASLMQEFETLLGERL